MLDILDIINKSQCFAQFFKQIHWFNFILCPVHYFTIDLQIRNLKKKPERLINVRYSESIACGSDIMEKYLDKWTCRRTSSFQHVTYQADKW